MAKPWFCERCKEFKTAMAGPETSGLCADCRDEAVNGKHAPHVCGDGGCCFDCTFGEEN